VRGGRSMLNIMRIPDGWGQKRKVKMLKDIGSAVAKIKSIMK